MSPVTFGKRVVGHEAFEKAVRDEKGGVAVFGKRVRDEIGDGGPIAQAKRNSEFGIRTIDHASFQDAKGKVVDAVAVEDIVNILAENPTFFDSLYEAELARADGARPDALYVFQEVERGIKGAGREEILNEIKGLLGEKSATADQRANLIKAQSVQLQEQAAREEENTLIADAPRMRALAQREEDLAFVKKGASKSGKSQLVSPTTEGQVRAIADREGLDLPGDDKAGKQGHVPAKPEGNTHPETQQPGNRPLTPKGSPGTRAPGRKGAAKKSSTKKSGTAKDTE